MHGPAFSALGEAPFFLQFLFGLGSLGFVGGVVLLLLGCGAQEVLGDFLEDGDNATALNTSDSLLGADGEGRAGREIAMGGWRRRSLALPCVTRKH